MNYDIELVNRIIGVLAGTEREVEIPFVLENLPEPPAKLLDVSCCYSSFLLEMIEAGFDCWGIDIQDYPCDRFIKADARDIPFKDKFFDVVTCISSLEHYGLVETPYHSDTEPDPLVPFTAIDEMVRVLKDDGIIILTLPFGYGDEGLSKWIKFYNIELINELIGFANLKIIKKQIKALTDTWRDIDEKEAEKVFSHDNKVYCNISLVLEKC